MKTVNVFVCIQMDIPNQDEDHVTEVHRVLDNINTVLSNNIGATNNAQIFVNDVDSSNIVNPNNDELCIDDEVEVPEPIEGDLHQHSFVGKIVDIKDNIATVEDGDGDCWDIEVDRLTYYI